MCYSLGMKRKQFNMRADEQFFAKLRRLRKLWIGTLSDSAIVRALVDDKLAQLEKRK